ncbi:MAG: biotin--[acetyl-CoA-carboxylase] ligase [Spirochaetaceae bacterium]|nr:biotin--[acetyl-CoA-carboxylase] ligase [Spirochaetaceae bacterium]
MKTLVLANPFAAPVFHAETLSSTMDAARALAFEGKPHGTVITADFQTAGRGRIGRSWQSQRGENLFFTILLRYDYTAIPTALPLKAGLAVSLAVEDFLRSREPAFEETPQVKWPNDIMLGGRKAVGILAEGDGKTVYIGIGVNLGQREFPEDLRNKAVSLALACEKVFSTEDRFPLLEKILVRFFEILADPVEDQWRRRLLERLYLRNQPVRFIPGGADSAASVYGVLHGVGTLGELLLIPRGGTEPVSFVTGELDVYGKPFR